MGKYGHLAMRNEFTDQVASDMNSSDLKELGNAAKNLTNHLIKLVHLGSGNTTLEWIASFAVIYLLVLDRTHWKTNMLTALLIPYIYVSLPSFLFSRLSGEIANWFAFVAVVVRLFFPRHSPDRLEFPTALILVIVVAPSLLSDTIRGSWIGAAICLVIAIYLLQEHIHASGGLGKSFTGASGISNIVGIIILVVCPAWALVLDILYT